ncbi:MAG TPA: hypothetical protein DF712_04490 [Balneola sp.]|nr:hypothetical protein [Balneola sp.]
MGFLDNSGDIILDAVLTDVGRKRMAEGDFRIAKFSPGDDEIDYSLYNPNHPSGSAYYDLEILQSPIMESATKQASSIKYGLLSITRTDLVYMPSIKINEKVSEAFKKTNNVYHLAVNRATYQNLTGLIDESFVMEPNTKTPSKSLIIESGIETGQRQPTLENRTAMIVETNLNDSNYEFRFDSRFIAGINALQGGKFANLSDGTRDVSLNVFTSRPSIGASSFIGDFSSAIASSIPNLVAKRENDTTGDTLSEFTGPRGTLTAATFIPSTEINAEGSSTPSFYTLYGRTGLTEAQLGVGSGSTLYDVIDTTIYVVGLTSGVQLQVPLRLVRKQG